jgi:hypothetical protein
MTAMTEYLLAVYQPDVEPPPDLDLGKVMQRVGEVQEEMKAAGVWVFSGGLYPPGTATVVQVKDHQMLMTDGPYVEGKEHLGGFTIIDVPDLDAALEWARKAAHAVEFQGASLPIEVRPFRGHNGE